MKLAVLGAVALPVAAVSAHNVQERHVFARQSQASSAPAAASSAVATGSAVVSGSAAVSSASFSSLPVVSWSLPSINPTAISLSDIVAGTLTTQPQLGASTTFAPGTTPTVISSAPALPNCKFYDRRIGASN